MNPDRLDKFLKELERRRRVLKPIWLRRSTMCVMPVNPENGSYAITDAPNANPGDRFESAELTVTCQPNFRVLGEKKVVCADGNWSDYFPLCVYESDEFDIKQKTIKLLKKYHKLGKCVLPANPDNGSYAITDAPNANPGDKFNSAMLTVTCQANFTVLGEEKIICTDGHWSDYFPECIHEQSERRRNKQETTKPIEYPNRRRQSNKCVMPDLPENGSYAITDAPNANPGDMFESAVLTVTCQPNFSVLGEEKVICANGNWSAPIPKCVRFCKLPKHASVRYECLVKGAIKGTRKCNRIEPSGTEVKPRCKRSNYYSTALRIMRCMDGRWNYDAICSPECGRVTPTGEALTFGGRPAKHGELPWHVGIYHMPSYTQECGGSIVSNRLVISAAHCFWKRNMKQPASLYAVAAGKIYRTWNNSNDAYAQKSSVDEIKIPARFRGNWLNFQNDIALLILKTRFKYTPDVSPVCLDFSADFDNRQLQPGNMGTVSGWGLTAENGDPAEVLKVVQLPYVDIDECINASPPGFTKYITSDKFCAGFLNECGRVTPTGEALTFGGRPAKHGELPWHVGIYHMPSYTQECGGSIVSNRLVISAAHCFWKRNMKQPASLYAVAAGKIYRTWNNSNDAYAQKSSVDEIKIPARFRGNWLNFQNDIALLILKTRFKYTPDVSPVCLDFSADFDNRQLQPGNMGTVSGWGLTAENGDPAEVLKVVQLPSVDIDECINASPPGFTKYITSDKFCAGFLNGTAALCRGDSGGGLAFPALERGTERFYLRGIVSTAPTNEHSCNIHALTTFTHILLYKDFIAEHLPLESV